MVTAVDHKFETRFVVSNFFTVLVGVGSGLL
jgi:hypothetical protein